MEINREYRSSVFAMLFNDRKELLTLYNAINGTAYTEEDRVISELPFYGSSFCSQKKHRIIKFASQIETNFQYRRCGGGA